MSSLRWLAPLALLVAACAPDRLTRVDAAPPTAVVAPVAHVAADGSDEPHFLQAAADAPTVANPVMTFWAKRGVDRTVTMVYHAAPGARDSVTLLWMRFRARSLLRRPDGSAIADGDSVQITLTLVDAVRGIVDCQPSGLRFDPKDPVRLKVSFAETDEDVNGDGVVTSADSALVNSFQVWRQESSVEPWLPVASKVAAGSHEVEADIFGFTGYAIAW